MSSWREARSTLWDCSQDHDWFGIGVWGLSGGVVRVLVRCAKARVTTEGVQGRRWKEEGKLAGRKVKNSRAGCGFILGLNLISYFL